MEGEAMRVPRSPYTPKDAEKFPTIPHRTLRSDARYRRRCSTCRRFLAKQRRNSYCSSCHSRRIRKQRVEAYRLAQRAWRAKWQAGIALERLQEDDWWLYFIEPQRDEELVWIRERYAYAFI